MKQGTGQQAAFPIISQSNQTSDIGDYSNMRVFCGLSGGINSAGVLCHLGSEYPEELKPKHLFLFYAHIMQHSPGTLRFVRDCIAYAKSHFEQVTWGASRGDVLELFRGKRMIPHPMLSPCTEHLKLIPMLKFQLEHGTDIDLVGYVRDEVRRVRRQQAKEVAGKAYPIVHFSNEYCFEIVKREIGWYPPIYDIRDEQGKRVFKHNNCLPCKNMTGQLTATSATGQFIQVVEHFPAQAAQAQALAGELGAYWGRKPGEKKGCDSVCGF